MEVIFFMLPMALFFALAFVILFVWNVRGGQYDDLETPAYEMLIEQDQIKSNTINNCVEAHSNKTRENENE